MNESAVAEALEFLVKKYELKRIEPKFNESDAYLGTLEKLNIYVSRFALWAPRSWISVSIALGEVRHVSNSSLHLGEFGMAHATSDCRTPESDFSVGSAISGNEILGFKWRFTYIGPKTRNLVGKDLYLSIEDPIKEIIENPIWWEILAEPESNPLTSWMFDWDGAIPGWSKGQLEEAIS